MYSGQLEVSDAGMYLSKSEFKTARTCPRKLYYRKRGYPSTCDEDEYLERLAEGGYMVEKIAKLLYPEGREIGFEQDPVLASSKTLKALESDVTLFEATFISGQKLARVDIVICDGNELQIIEVKAKSYSGQPGIFRTGKGLIASEWREYLEDVTFQAAVLKELFPKRAVRSFLMMPDKSKTTQIDDVRSLFNVTRQKLPGSSFERIIVSFTGDAERLRGDHFLSLVPVSNEVDILLPTVRQKADEFVASLNPELQKLPFPISVHCRDCEFRATEDNPNDGFKECWGSLAEVSPHIFDLYHMSSVGGKNSPIANKLIERGKVSLFDITPDVLVDAKGNVGERNKRQIIQLEHTRSNTEWINEDLPEILRTYQYPLHFIDFETTALGIPYHAGMRPYEPVAFQWSCHSIRTPNGTLEHCEWINTESSFPNFQFAESLMALLGTEGTIFMWATHENTILEAIRRQMTERGYASEALRTWLDQTIGGKPTGRGRLVDMNRITLKNYFHPLMKGKTSIKVVADAIWKTNPALRAEFPAYFREEHGMILSPYKTLPPIEIENKPVVVAEGTGAIRAYEAMLYGAEHSDAQLKNHWRELLLQYCKLDTLSMVMVWKHWWHRIQNRGREGAG